MKAALLIVLIAALPFVQADAEDGFRGRPLINNLWSPTGHTLHRAEFSLGLGNVAFGITENIQVGTNVLLYLFQITNADIKINFYESHKVAVAGGFEYRHFDLSPFIEEGDEVNLMLMRRLPRSARELVLLRYFICPENTTIFLLISILTITRQKRQFRGLI